MGSIVTLSKFVGTVSLGLLTGASYNLATTTLPALLALPTATSCSNTLTHLVRISSFHRQTLTAIPLALYTIAYALSPSRARHPYLLWTSLVAAISGFAPSLAFKLKREEPEEEAVKFGRHGEEEVNGESIRQNVLGLRKQETLRATLAGFAFSLSVVGLWGDGY